MKRLNPKTDAPFVLGDVREDGFIFNGYKTGRVRKNGTYVEVWRDSKVFFRERVSRILDHAKYRSKAGGIPFDIDVDYAISIYPSDSRCPILGTLMSLGGERRTSPSLDRIIPAKGYTRGNLCWISYKANVIKQDVTDPEVFMAIANYVRGCTTQHTTEVTYG